MLLPRGKQLPAITATLLVLWQFVVFPKKGPTTTIAINTAYVSVALGTLGLRLTRALALARGFARRLGVPRPVPRLGRLSLIPTSRHTA